MKNRPNKKIHLICSFCKKSFIRYKSAFTKRYCSASCRSKNGNFSQLEKHQGWLGDNVGYWGIHKWINRHFKKPTMCQNCGKDNLYKWSIHWANISGNYRRDINDWIALCQSCHRRFDNGKITIKDSLGTCYTKYRM